MTETPRIFEDQEKIAQEWITPITEEKPKLGWWARRRARKEAERRAQWEAEFRAEVAKEGSYVNRYTRQQATLMAHGMLMRHFDDHGITRCIFCVSTDQLRKRSVGVVQDARGRQRFRFVMVCPAHEKVELPGPEAGK